MNKKWKIRFFSCILATKSKFITWLYFGNKKWFRLKNKNKNVDIGCSLPLKFWGPYIWLFHKEAANRCCIIIYHNWGISWSSTIYYYHENYTHLLFPRLQHPPSIFRTISLQYILLSNESMLALSNHDYISNFWYQNKCHIIIIICKQDCITKIENLFHLKSPYTISHLSLQLVSFFGKDECPLEFTTCNLPPFGCGKLKLVMQVYHL